MVHPGKKPIFADIAARHVANLPRFGGRTVVIGLKHIKEEGEDTVIT